MFDRLYRHGRVAGIFLAAALLNACGGGSATAPDTEPFYLEPESEWALVWADEFEGSTVDSSNWTFQVGDGTDYGLPEPGWGNGERQWYQADNAAISDDGTLVITASEEAMGGMPYTSSRMRSLNKFDFQYGRVELRAKAAPGQGLWSAIWMMPSDSPYGTWAASGEIDIMEVVNAGTENQGVFLAAHHGFQWPLNQIVTAPAEVDDASDWHTYALEWSGEYLRWFVDGEHLRTVNKDAYYAYFFGGSDTGFELAADPSAPFNQDFHLIVNLAVGGNAPGFINPADVDGSALEVDYIRVYECSYGQSNGTGCNTFADRSLDTPEAASPFIDETILYSEGAATLSGERALAASVGYDNNGAMVVVDDSSVINITTSGGGNAVINAVNGETFELNNFYGAGELKFDMYIDSSGTAPSSDILIKMDSGYPALGQVALAVADLPTNEWFSYSIPVRDFVENPGESPLNLQSVVNLIVVEPTGAASLKLDNVSLKCASPYRRGCGISPPVQVGDGSTLVVLDEIGLGGGFWDLGVGGSSTDSGFASYYASGSNQVTWSNTGESLLVNFASSSEFGVWFVQSSAPGVDLSLYEDSGFLRFDLKAPQETIASGLNYKVENEYPDGTGDLSLDLSEVSADEWTSIEIPVAELLASTNAGNYTDPRPGDPLDISAVQAAIVMWPAGDQGGKFFEIRNIRYENDPGAAGDLCPSPTVFGAADISEAFGGTTIEEGGIYTYPSAGSETWGGFANTNTDMYPMSFPNGGTITFNAAIPTGGSADVRFMFEFNPYPDVNPFYATAAVTVTGSEVAQYTVDIPEQGENTYSSFLMYLNTQDVGVQVTNVTVAASAPPCEEANNDTVLDAADFSEAFGGSTLADGTYTFPAGAEAWAGFANLNTDLYPLAFPFGATISFTGSVPDGGAVDLRFRFEFNPYPDVDPAYDTDAITVSGADAMTYSIDVPSQGENTFSSFLMYLNTQDIGVAVSDVVITVKGEPVPVGEALDPAAFTEAFGGATHVEGAYTFPTGAEAWAGFANLNTDLYPLAFPNGALITFTGSVPSGVAADVRFRFEFNPYPDVDPSHDTPAVTVSGADPAVYEIEIPSQGENTFSSFLMYLNTQDVTVEVSDVIITVL